MADAVENEDKDYCFTIHDPTNGQPEKPKLGFALMTMLANVRRNCVKPALHEGKTLVLKRKNAQLELDFATAKEVVLAQKFQIVNCSQY